MALLKDTVTELYSFPSAVDRVAAGESVVDRAIVRRLLGRPNNTTHSASSASAKILALVAEGRARRQSLPPVGEQQGPVRSTRRTCFQVAGDMRATAPPRSGSQLRDRPHAQVSSIPTASDRQSLAASERRLRWRFAGLASTSAS
jgi:hypothetical protein